jgi:hypothetical protein
MMCDLEMNVGPVTFKTNADGTKVTASAPSEVVAFCAALWKHFLKELGDTYLEPGDVRSDVRHDRRDQLMDQMGRMIAITAAIGDPESDDDD